MSKFFESHRENLMVSTNPDLLDLDAICDFLSRAYWAQGRPRDRIELSLRHSLVFGIYGDSRQIGLARVVTDYATFAWLCDVFIHEDYRGRGIGKWLMACILSHPELQGLRRFLLATRDAHGLYSQFGFTSMKNPERWMERFND
jgi:N-acetylglutamate synthase-like GNAT family acetyltransferase